jgi:hypothetical protein
MALATTLNEQLSATLDRRRIFFRAGNRGRGADNFPFLARWRSLTRRRVRLGDRGAPKSTQHHENDAGSPPAL